MNAGGFVLMVAAWAAITALCIWCFYKLFSEKKAQPAHSTKKRKK